MTTRVQATATQAEEVAAIDTIVLAFAADPIGRWCWPDPHDYLTNMPSFSRAFAGAAFRCGSADRTEDGAGVALWMPPGEHPDEEAMGLLLESTIAASTRADLLAVFEKAAECHPSEPHWYLPLIGVDPAHQGRGIGGALMRYALERCDRDHSTAYLESSNPRNISLYRRHGFEVLPTLQVGTSPAIVPMVRPARAC